VFAGGTLLFYNTQELSDYKKDGWHWQKRKDKSGRVRERIDRMQFIMQWQADCGCFIFLWIRFERTEQSS
jgi:hypothetical protein